MKEKELCYDDASLKLPIYSYPLYSIW